MGISKRISKDNYYLNLAQESLKRGTCIRRNYGAIIVKNDEVVSTGYTGSPRGRKNCCDDNICLREQLKIPSGQRYELCRSVHAEMNACLHASRRDMYGATMYLCGFDMSSNKIYDKTIPCELCKRVIINSGIVSIVIRRTETEYDIVRVEDWIAEEPSTT